MGVLVWLCVREKEDVSIGVNECKRVYGCMGMSLNGCRYTFQRLLYISVA